MDAKRCDRCKAFYMPYLGKARNYYSNTLIFAEESSVTYEHIEVKKFELCSDCMDEIGNYIRAFEKDENEEDSECGLKEP